MTLKDKLIIYLYNKSNSISDSKDEHLHYMRFHSKDEVDFLECIIQKVRQDTFNEVCEDIITLIKINGNDIK